MKPQQFLYNLVKKAFCITTVFLLIVLFIDPYGINHWGFKIPRINEIKYERVNIDRLIKPWEVYWKQPKTIFMGTSRPHQSLNPEVLDNSVFAPAYNAAVPASSIDDHTAFIQEYIQSNPSLKYIILDVFWRYWVLHNKDLQVIKQAESDASNHQCYDNFYIRVFTVLCKFFSIEGILDSFLTFKMNFSKEIAGTYITASGYLLMRGGDSSCQFPDYGENMLKQTHGTFHKFGENFFHKLSNLYDVCEKNGVALILTILPEHSVSDHFYMETGQFVMLEYFLKRLAHYPNVYYFSSLGGLDQPNPYWWDPHHPSITVGNMVLDSIKTDKPNSTIPDFGVLLTPQNVEKIISHRKKGLKEWMAANEDYILAYKETKKKYLPIKVISPTDPH